MHKMEVTVTSSSFDALDSVGIFQTKSSGAFVPSNGGAIDRARAAKAIAAKGKAEADVLAAMYRAKAQNREVFLAEVERDIAKDLYTNLKDFKIEMPHNYIGGGGGGGGSPGKLTSNLDVITALGALGLMDKSKAMR